MTKVKIKRPLSKIIYNRGISPIVIKKTIKENIVLHPRKIMRLEAKEADKIIKNNKNAQVYDDFLKEEKEKSKLKEK